MYREDEMHEFKKTTGEMNEDMISIASILNKHGQGVVYFGLKNDGTPYKFVTIPPAAAQMIMKVSISYFHIG